MKDMLIVRVLACAAMAVLAGADPAGAGQAAARSVDARWVPWLGCWELLQEGGAPAGPAEDLRVCVVPEGPAGVKMTTLAGATTVLEDSIVADGVEHPVTDPSCTGWQRAEWSLDGTRLFAGAELTCGSQALRRISGLTLMAPGGVWLDIQSVEIDGPPSVRVRRYRRASDRSPVAEALAPDLLDRAAAASLSAAAFPFTIAGVIEASGRVSAPALEAVLIETRARFDLDRGALIRLDDAGVADSVVDVMIALTYPDRFVLDRPDSTPVVSHTGPISGSYGFDPFWYGLDGFGPYYPYYYSPFGYSGWGRYYGYTPYYDYRGDRFLIVPGGSGDARERAVSPGRVVNDRGYTRVRPRGAGGDDAPSSGGSGGSTRSSSGGSRGSSPEGSGGSSGGGAVTPQGATGGGSGDTGRTAVPR